MCKQIRPPDLTNSSSSLANPKSEESELEHQQYYQWSECLTSYHHDRMADRCVNVGTFPFYQEVAYHEVAHQEVETKILEAQNCFPMREIVFQDRVIVSN